LFGLKDVKAPTGNNAKQTLGLLVCCLSVVLVWCLICIDMELKLIHFFKCETETNIYLVCMKVEGLS